MILTDAMHDAVKNSPVGQFLDRLIREEVERSGNTSYGSANNVIQDLWIAFGGQLPEAPADFTEVEQLAADIIGRKNVNEISFRELKQEIKNGVRP